MPILPATISATIITKNEEKHIKDCIESVLWTDEIIILDSGSTDNTLKICKQYTPKVKLFETDWQGFGKQKTRALEQTTSEWILSIDADERVTPELKEEILQTLKQPSFEAYKIPMQNHFLRKPLKFCCGSDYHIRLAKKSSCKFTDDVVHEQMIISGNSGGNIGKLQKKLNHFSIDKLEESIEKINNYSTLGALKLKQNKENVRPIHAFGHALWIFIKIYFLRLGFLDGLPGFVFAFSNLEGTFYKYIKLLEQKYSETK